MLSLYLPCGRFIEAVKDPKTWLFAGHALTQELGNGTTNQYSLIINSFGFTVLQTTLLGTVTGAVSFVSLAIAAVVLYNTKVKGLHAPRLLIADELELSSVDLAACLYTHRAVQHPAAR